MCTKAEAEKAIEIARLDRNDEQVNKAKIRLIEAQEDLRKAERGEWISPLDTLSGTLDLLLEAKQFAEYSAAENGLRHAASSSLANHNSMVFACGLSVGLNAAIEALKDGGDTRRIYQILHLVPGFTISEFINLID